MKIATGIKKLDEKLGGGFEAGFSILLVGTPGSGKSTFCNQFVWEGVKKNEGSIYVTFNSTPEEIIKTVGAFNWEFPENLVRFIDAYSWQTGVSGKNIVNPADLTKFTITLTKVINEMRNKNLRRIVFDSFSTLFLFVPQELCLKFISMLTAKLKMFGLTQIIVIEEGMHPQSVMTTLNMLTDGTIRLSVHEDAHALKVERMKGFVQTGVRGLSIERMKGVSALPFMLNFRIGNSGIEVV